MTRNEIASKDLWESAERWLPVFSPREQEAGMVLLRELVKGEPLTVDRLARALGISVEVAEELVKDSALRPFINWDGAGSIQGFWGLSVVPTRHKLAVAGRTLWTWCAEDALFMPELLGVTAEIESRDPQSGQAINLTVSPDHVEAVEPVGIVVSMGRPETWDATSASRIIATACHFIFFFGSRASGERWQSRHPMPGTDLLSLGDAVAYGKRSNARLFGAELAQRRADVA